MIQSYWDEWSSWSEIKWTKWKSIYLKLTVTSMQFIFFFDVDLF